MPAWSVNNTLIIGIELAAMIAVGLMQYWYEEGWMDE